MIKMEKETKRAVIILIGILFFLPLTSANYIGISPASIFFENVLRNGYSERNVIVTINTETPTSVEIEPRGEIAGWLNFSAENFDVSKNSPYSLKISVTPPADMPNGNYTGFLRVRTSPKGGGKEGYATGIIHPVLDLSIKVEVTDTEILNCGVSNFEIFSAEKGDPIILKTEVSNKGNIRLKPSIRVDIWNQEQTRIIKTEEFSGDEILPTTSEKIINEISSNDLDIEQYWAEVSVIECYASRTLTFDVLEIGALKSSGELTKIIVTPWHDIGETLTIKAFFKNTGEKRVNAQFKGTINLDGKIAEIIESELINTEIDEEEEFLFYFTPKKSGKYIVTGRVFYDKKRTFEKSAVFNVRPKEFSLFRLLIYGIYFAFLAGIVILIFKIRRERKKIKETWRYLRRWKK